MIDRKDAPYSVGYGRPPRATRFLPGQSGNPKGRPKGARNLSDAIDKELDVRIAVTENGKRKTITKRQAVAKQLVNKAVAGYLKALPTLLSESRQHESRAAMATTQNVLHTAEDALVVANIVRRIRETAEPTVSPGSGADDAANTRPGVPPPTGLMD